MEVRKLAEERLENESGGSRGSKGTGGGTNGKEYVYVYGRGVDRSSGGESVGAEGKDGGGGGKGGRGIGIDKNITIDGEDHGGSVEPLKLGGWFNKGRIREDESEEIKSEDKCKERRKRNWNR